MAVDVGGGDEVFDVLVLEDERAVLVGLEKLGRAVGAGVFAGAVVGGDAAHLVLRADGDDELDAGAEDGVGGGEEREAAGEAEAHDADWFGVVVLARSGMAIQRGVADGADGVGGRRGSP